MTRSAFFTAATVGLLVLTSPPGWGEVPLLVAESAVTQATAALGLAPAQPADNELRVLFSNLSEQRDARYLPNSGFPVSAADSHLGRWGMAMPFTVTSNGVLRQVQLALSWRRGSNAAAISLRADAAGMPGQVLAKTRLADMAKFGRCCALQTWLTKPVPVTAGTTYWLVARAEGDTELAWNLNLLDDQAVYASKRDAGWQRSQSAAVLGAFSVLGD